MARTFSLSLIVALLLIFAITEASRGQTNQTDGQKTQNRGATRYNSKSTTESSSLSTSETSLPRDKSSRSEAITNLEKHETHFAREGSIRSRSKLKQSQAADDSTATSRSDASSRHLNTSADNSRKRQKSHTTEALKEEITRDNDNKENAPESRTPKRPTASRRTSSDASLVWVDNAKLDHEVFTKSDRLRSRTGRKIYVNHERESKGEIIPTRESPENENVEKVKSPSSESEKEEVQLEFSKIVTSNANVSKKIDTKKMNNSSSRKGEAKDVLLSGSESVRVDVPLTVGNDEDIDLLTSATASSVSVSPRGGQASKPVTEKVESNDIARSNTKNRQSNRSKSRNRSKTRDPNLENANSGSTSRRGSSRSDSTATAEPNRQSSNSRHRSSSKNVNSRGRSTHKSRDAVTAEARNSDRQRNADTYSETNARRTDTQRNGRRTSEGKRRSKDSRSKAEVKVDEQDIRVQSRSRSRAATSNLDITTTYIPKATIAETTTVPSVDAEITTSSSTIQTTIRPSTTSTSTERASRNRGRDRGESSRAKKPPKEDFFNHGLGFRGRKTSTEASTSIVAEPRPTMPKNETQLRGNPGWTLRRRPGYVNQDASSSITSTPINRDASSSTTSTPINRDASSSTTSTPINRDQTNEIVLLNDSPRSTETPLSNAKAGRRGTKRPKAKDESDIVSGVTAKSTTRGSKTFNKSESFGLPKGAEPESDNYPPAFRARLSQLKSSNSKPTEGKSTTRTSLQATKPSLTSLFSERSKMKLELARRLIKPELNVDENDFDVTTAAYSDKSKEVSTVSESRNVEKTTKANSKLIGTRTTHGSSTIASASKEKSPVRGRWKILETRKLLKDRNIKAPLRLPTGTTKKSRVTSERASSFIEETSSRNFTEFNAIPRLITVSHRGAVPVEATAATTFDMTKVRSPTSTTASREEASTLTNTVETIEENSIITTIEPLKLDKTFIETITVTSGAITDASTESKSPTEFPQEVTLPPTVTTVNDILSSSTPSTSEKIYPVYIPDAKEYDLSGNKEKTITLNDSSRSSIQSRYTNQEQPDKVTVSMVTSKTAGPTSRYIRKKSGVFTPYDSIPKTSNTEATLTQTKRREFRPRTSTYRRHSEVPTSQLVVQQPATIEQTTTDVTITPKPTKYHAQVEPSTRSSFSDPLVSVRIDTSNDTTSRTSGIAGNSNGNSGNSNIFNPTRSTYLTANTTTLLEQLRSTVAPLLNNLGDKTPIFSGAYSNVNTGNSAPRITPNGSPPRFSARYKGAELFVRKPSVGQAVVPSITTSSTTVSTLIEVFPTKVPEDSEAVAPPSWTNSIASTPSSDLNSGSAPPVAINSPGEPRFITFYQALESASIRNENLGAEDMSQRQRLTGVVTKVDPNATVPNGASNDIANNNDTIAPSITATTTTSSPDITTVDPTTAIQSANNSLASRLGAQSSTDGNSEITTTAQTPANPDTNGGETIPVSISESSRTIVPVNTITNTPPSTTTETTTSTSIADNSLVALFSTESVPNDVQSTESIDTSTKTVEVATLPITETVNVRVSMPAFQNLQTASDTPDTTVPFPITESVTHLPPEATTIFAMNDTSESIETNTVQQSEETTPRITETTVTIEDIETNTIQQSDAISFQTTEITSTEPTTTEEISNDIIEIRATAAPAFSSTYRTRLVDYAQDILSLLSQKGVSTIETPVQRPIATTTVSPDLSNAIPDSSTNTENPAQPEETTIVRVTEPGNDETTVSFDVEFVPITTNGPDEINRNTIGVNTTLQDQSNDQGINAQNTLDSNTTTGQTFSSTVGNERNTSDPELTTIAQDTRAPLTNGTVATTTPTPTSRLVESITENDLQSSNDTLLTELMTIAKTLFTEAMNDTRQSGQTDDTVGNDRNRIVSVLNGTSEVTTAPSELLKPLESTTERIDITTPIDLFGNERGEMSSIRGPVVRSNISLVESNTRPADVGDVTTMSLSQMKIETSNTTMVTASMSSELTTNTPDSQLSNPIELSSNNTEQQTITTVSNNETQLSNRLSEFATNNPLMSSVTANTEGMLSTSDVNEFMTSDMVTELTTRVAVTEINVVQTNVVDTTNQTPVPITIVPASDLQVTNDQSLIANASDITTTLPIVSDTSDTQPFDTEPPITESVHNLVSFTDTNQLNDTTTNAPQMLTDLVSEMPNLITRLQDTTSTTTAQGTAGSRIIQPEQTTETIITTTTTVPTITTSSTASTTDSTISPVSFTDASTILSSSVESTVATTTTTSTTTFRTTSMETLSRSELTTTIGSTSEMTTTADINDNLVSTETTTDISTTRGTTVPPTESEDLNMISRINGEETTTTMTTTSAAPPTNDTNTSTTTTSTTARTIVLNQVPSFPTFTPSGASNTQSGPYLGRFGGSQMTPLPRPSSSNAPVRDYLIYGIYPNKTIVRKRPEDNVIDGRNVDSPYVIFGIYPDGRLVRKFPNGTIIPDSPRNPVEVVFTLRTTTTTNRPAPGPYYNQANQAGVYNNQYQAPVYYSNGRPVDDLTGGAQNPGSLDFGLIGNAIGVTPGGPNFAGPFGPPASVPSTNKMSDILLNSQMGALPNSPFGNLQRPNSGQVQGPPTIIQDRERNEASRTKVTSNQNSAVYIGQDKFINYQIDGARDINPKVVDVRINSVATSVNEGTASSTASNPSFENLLNNQSSNNVITAPPGFPWRDPLDQIFGITTNSPIQTASVASNQLDEPIENNAPIVSRINSMVEVFTPVVSTAVTSPFTITTTTAGTTPTTTTTTVSTTIPTTTSTTTSTTTTSTTTPTTTSTTLAPTTTAATTTAATTTTTTTSTTTPATTTTSQTTITPARIGTIPPSSTISTMPMNNILSRLQANTVENPFGSTYGDLAFLNSLLQNNNDVKSTTPKTLSEVEQLLANRILSLALANPGPTRSAKAIHTANLNVNAIKNSPKSPPFRLSSEPIIIDLLPFTSPTPSVSSTSPTKKYTETITTTKASTAPTITTKAPVIITAKPKTTVRPKATTPRASVGFGAGLWRALFGNNLLDATTAASAAKKKPTIKATTQKPASTTQASVQIIKSTLTNHVIPSIKSPTTPRSIGISDIHVASSTSLADSIISASTPNTISTTILNNPRLRDVSTSTYSPEDDAKFLAALLQTIQTETRTSTSATTRLNEDDEAFLRAILSNQASISTTTSSSTEVNPAALLALLLKQQGIEPTTPATKLREQLSNQGLTPDVTSITTRPTTTNRPVSTAKQMVTSRPSARPRPTENILQTTTWAPSSTYPPPLFGGSGSGSGLVTATRAIGRFLGAAISGAAQQLQSLLRNSTRSAAG